MKRPSEESATISPDSNAVDYQGKLREIQKLLRIALVNQKKLRYDKAQEAFESAIQALDVLEDVTEIEAITGQAYGLYGECLAEQKLLESERYLVIAENFGYVRTNAVPPINPSSLPSTVFASTDQSNASLLVPGMSETTLAWPNSLLFIGPAVSRALPSVKTSELSKFLKLVAEGKQNQAEAMLKKTPALTLCRGTVTDLSQRTFEDITAFEYAVWALDWHMWKMLRNYLPEKAAQAQAQQCITGSWVGSHGVHVGPYLQSLIGALTTYVNCYKLWTLEQRGTYWQRHVGGAQILLPAHAVNEYCRPDRALDPSPNFLEASLPRTQKIVEGDWFTAVYNGGKLGENFGVFRGALWNGLASAGNEPLARWWRVGGNQDTAFSCAGADALAISLLTKVRLQQREQLLVELSVSEEQRLRP